MQGRGGDTCAGKTRTGEPISSVGASDCEAATDESDADDDDDAAKRRIKKDKSKHKSAGDLNREHALEANEIKIQPFYKPFPACPVF